MIRDATPADLPRILEITNQAIAETTAVYSLTPATFQQRAAWMAERQAAGLPVLVSELSGEVAGFGSFAQYRPWEGYLHTVEHSIYVWPAAQGQGIGRALLTALIERARAQGRHVMVGGVDAANAASIRFHAGMGFETAGTLREVGRKFDRWLDLTFMTFRLEI